MNGGTKKLLVAAIAAVPTLIVGSMLAFFMLILSIGGQCSQSTTAGSSADGTTAVINNTNYQPPEHSSDPAAENLTAFAEGIALDDSHGYSQSRRNGDGDFDCSSLVFFAVKAAGIGLQGAPFSTFTMGPILQAHGFTHFTYSGRYDDAKTQLKRGDIVVNTLSHTEIYAGGGLFVGAHHATPRGVEDGHPGDQGTGDNQEIGIEPGIMPGLTNVFRHDPNATDTGNSDGSVVNAGSSSTTACNTSSGVSNVSDVTDGSVASAQQAAKQLIPEYSPGSNVDEQQQCLVQLWDHESGWRVNAENPSSHAYGIPQALPPTKLAEMGADWKTNATTQIRWGLKYIKGRADYGTPCAAWTKWQSRSPHWY